VRSRNHHGDCNRNWRVKANHGKSRPGIPPINRIGMNTATAKGSSKHCRSGFFEPFRALPSGGRPLPSDDDIFHNHDGVIDYEPCRDGEAMSDKLSRVYPQRYITANCNHRDRDCNSWDQGGSCITAAKGRQRDHQGRSTEQCPFHIFDGGSIVW